MRKIGLHLRLEDSLATLMEKVDRLQLDFFQCFFVAQSKKKVITLDNNDVKRFLQIRRDRFDALYAHASYWVNLASLNYNGHRALQREIAMAKRLEFTHIILHPGSANGALERVQGIDALARALNKIVQHENDITIVLENTTHASLTVGSNMHDFHQLRQKLDKPEKIQFCIDTSHAHAYGYNMAEESEQDSFIRLLNDTVGLENIALLHLNDTKKSCGSRIDRHECIGDGVIGEKNLRYFAMHEKLKQVPILMELPVVPEEIQKQQVQLVRSWHIG